MKALAKLKDIKGWRLVLLFLACAVLALAVLLIPFLVRGNHLIWAEQAGDGATQHLTFLAYLREVGWLKAVGAYDFSFGLGADFLTSMGFMSLFDPFNVLIFILLLFFPPFAFVYSLAVCGRRGKIISAVLLVLTVIALVVFALTVP